MTTKITTYYYHDIPIFRFILDLS